MTILKVLTVAALTAVPVAGVAEGISFDAGVGMKVNPIYPGAADEDGKPWLIWRNVGRGGDEQGWGISPSVELVGARRASDDPALAGLADVGRTVELGVKVSYGLGPVSAFSTLRKGFGGHDGWVGSVGAKMRHQPSERLTLWAGGSVGFADKHAMRTWFGVRPEEAAASRLPAYQPDGGAMIARATLEARFAIDDKTAVLGEVELGRLIGDAADRPVTQDRLQPAIRIGIVRRFSFGN